MEQIALTAGLTPPSYLTLEEGRILMSPEQAMQLSLVLQVTPALLLAAAFQLELVHTLQELVKQQQQIVERFVGPVSAFVAN